MTSKRDAYLRRTYGITERQFKEIIERQRGCCPICGWLFELIPGTPHVDHDHKTGEIRGVLCAYDNHRVVGRHRDPELLRRAARYLDGPFTGWFVPKKKKRRRRK